MLKKILSIILIGLFGFNSTVFAVDKGKNDPSLLTVRHFIQFNNIILMLFLIIFSTSVLAKVCVDDPRMFAIKTVLEQAELGKAYKPIKLTPTTFLMLTPPIRQALGDNIVVYNDQCIPQQIFKGQLPRKIEIPYEDLSYALHMALIQNDVKTANVIFNSFISAPKEPREIVMMLTPLEWHTSAIEKLYSLGMIDKRGMDELPYSSSKLCNSKLSRLSQLELFSALGGKASKQDLVVYKLSSQGITLYGRNFSARTKNFLVYDSDNECTPYSVTRVLSNLKTAMFDIQEEGGYGYKASDFFAKYDQAKKAKQTTYPGAN